MLITT